MKYTIGTKVVFFKKSNEKYAFELKNFQSYTILNRVVEFHKLGTIDYYSVAYNDGKSESSWYLEMDFIELKEYRKLKLKRLNDKTFPG